MTEPAYQNLRKFLLLEEDKAESIPPERRPWRRKALYLGPICAAVHLSVLNPGAVGEAEVEAARTALFLYLRQVAQRLLEHGMVLPLAAVIERPAVGPLARAMESWGSDQSWHRGGFTLYVEKSEKDEKDEKTAMDRLADLLHPRNEVLNYHGEEKLRTLEWFADQLKDLGNPLANQIADWLRPAPRSGRGSEPVSAWASEVIDRAGAIARGDKAP